MLKNVRNFFFLILSFAALDQISKQYIIYKYNVNTSNLNSQLIDRINSFLDLHLIWNKGFAFGFFQNDITFINNLYISLMLILILVLIIYAFKINQRTYYFCFSLIIGGAIGNLIDRFFYSAVFDFIYLHYLNYDWYVFNIADITISLGCVLIILLELFSKKTKSKNE